MMGHHSRDEALFHYFHLEDQVPENHLLRLIDKHISFEFVLKRLKASYNETGGLRSMNFYYAFCRAATALTETHRTLNTALQEQPIAIT
jgi:hypothetical protein